MKIRFRLSCSLAKFMFGCGSRFGVGGESDVEPESYVSEMETIVRNGYCGGGLESETEIFWQRV